MTILSLTRLLVHHPNLRSERSSPILNKREGKKPWQQRTRQKKRRTSRWGTGSANALWSRSTTNPDVSTGPLARLFARSLAPLTRLLALHYSLCSRAFVCSLVRSLYSLPCWWDSEWLDGYLYCDFFLFWPTVRSDTQFYEMGDSFGRVIPGVPHSQHVTLSLWEMLSSAAENIFFSSL